MKRILLLAMFSLVSLHAQTTVSVPNLTISAEATAALNSVFTGMFSGSYAILTAPVGVSDTVINVVSTAGISGSSAFMLEGEAVKITSKTATTFTVTRAYYGTTAAAHAQTVVANELKYASFLKAFVQAVTDFVGAQMDAANSTTIATQNAVITTAQAAKLAAKTAAVQ